MKIIQKTMDEFKKVAATKQIICFGAAKMGLEVLEVDEIAEHIVYFIDNDEQKWGHELKQKERSIPITSRNHINECFSENTIILITSSAYVQIIEQLKSIVPEDMEVYVYETMKLNMAPETKEYFHHRIIKPVEDALWLYYTYRYPSHQVNKILTDRMKEVEQWIAGKKRVIPAITFMLTTRCTLSCKHCLALTPYFKGKEYDNSVDDVLGDMKRFLESVDYCSRVAFLGGEPFLYKDFDILLRYLNENDKVESVFIPSNGTVLPDDKTLAQLKNKKVHIGLSYYGFLKEMSQIVTLFEQNDILFQVVPMDDLWIDAGGVEKRNKPKQILREENLRCKCTDNARLVEKGKLYCCGRTARMHALGILNSETDYVVLDRESKENRWNQILDLYLRDYAEGCDYCDFGSSHPIRVKSGEQMDNRHVSSYLVYKQSEYEELKKKAELWDIMNKETL